MQLLQTNADTNYGQIRDAEGRTVWLPLSQLSAEPSLRTRVPQLEQQVNDLTCQARQYRQQLEPAHRGNAEQSR